MIHPGVLRSFCTLVLAGLLLSACSGLTESERYKSQAEQFATEGRLAEAVLTYRQALKTDPNNPELLKGLGLALAAQGRDRSAARVLNQAAIINPDDVSIKDALLKLTIQPQDGLSLKLAWIVIPTDARPVGAAVAAGRIFIVYEGGLLMALDQASGQELWKTESSAAFTSSPAANGSQVWVGAEDGSILVYSAETGQALGSYHTQGAVYAAPALSADTAYCPSNDGSLYAVSRSSLNLTWKAVIGEAMHASPFVNDQAVYVGSNDGRLYAFNAASGERIWAYGFPTQGAIESIPVFANGQILFGSGDGRIYALDARTGSEVWHFSTPAAIYAQPLILNDQIIVASSGQVLVSIRTLDGSAIWNLRFDHPITETPALFKDQILLVTHSDPHLFVVDPQAGNMPGKVDTGDWIARGPFAVGNDLILIGEDGAVFLYR